MGVLVSMDRDGNNYVARPMMTAEQIQNRVRELGDQITEDYQGQDLLVVGVLNGAFLFLADLVRQIQLSRVQVHFISISSYGAGTVSTGEVQMNLDLQTPVEGCHVLLVEDIVDTGRSIDYLQRLLTARRPASLRVCTLLSKPARREVEVEVAYTGFEIDDVFVVGYGLDLGGEWRTLPGIYRVITENTS